MQNSLLGFINNWLNTENLISFLYFLYKGWTYIQRDGQTERRAGRLGDGQWPCSFQLGVLSSSAWVRTPAGGASGNKLKFLGGCEGQNGPQAWCVCACVCLCSRTQINLHSLPESQSCQHRVMGRAETWCEHLIEGWLQDSRGGSGGSGGGWAETVRTSQKAVGEGGGDSSWHGCGPSPLLVMCVVVPLLVSASGLRQMCCSARWKEAIKQEQCSPFQTENYRVKKGPPTASGSKGKQTKRNQASSASVR